MLQSKVFPKTKKEAPKGAESINHKLLVRAGFIDQLMAGSWTLLPLGLRVVDKINQVIREEMNATGAQEILMPLLHPKSIWNETGRWEKAREVMYQFKDTRGKEYALSFTHEEILLDLVRKHLKTYRDLPIALYHFSTKFRNEPRARSGILRGREFMMKDLYSVHATEDDFWKYYERVKEAYSNVFTRLGFKFVITEAPGGVFTDNKTHEFQVVAEGGEDVIFYCNECEWGENKELYNSIQENPDLVGDELNADMSSSLGKPRLSRRGGRHEGKKGERCPQCKKGEVIESKSIEVGNIFPFGTHYSKKMNVNFTDKNGKNKYPHFGSYGIGSTRVMGAWVEVNNDKRGIIWNKVMSPYDVHLVDISTKNKGQSAKKIYQKLQEEDVDVLLDDRDASAGEKFADADLIGIPVRLVVSDRTKDKIEWKQRDSEKTKLISFKESLRRLKK